MNKEDCFFVSEFLENCKVLGATRTSLKTEKQLNYDSTTLNIPYYYLLNYSISVYSDKWVQNICRILIIQTMKNSKGLKYIIFHTVDDNKVLLIRLVVGLVFLTEGIQKYLFPELLGTGRFTKIGFVDPAFWAYFTGTFEIVCGTLILLGLLTRLASVPLLVIMATAFLTTKWPLLAGKGFWVFAHEYRTDFAMTLLLGYLFISGSGRWSIDMGIKE
jgi:putative oxidoreductase